MDWLEGLNDEQKSFVTENKFENIGGLVDAFVKTKGAQPKWTDGLEKDHLGFLESKKFQSPKEIIDAYQNLEKFHGVPKDRLLKLPESQEDKEGWNAIFDRLGRPEKAEGYELKAEEEGSDEKLLQWASTVFHELGLSKSQAQGFVSKWNEYAKSLQTDSDQQHQLDVKEAEQALKTKWGHAYDKNTRIAENAAKEFNVSDEEKSALVAALGRTKFMEFFHRIGESLLEDTFHKGRQGHDGTLTPNAAEYEIKQLMNDKEFQVKLLNGDTDANTKWNRLHQMAYDQPPA